VGGGCTRSKRSKAQFEWDCLAEYVETFPTACGDFAFYQFPSAEYRAWLIDRLPTGFLLGLSVTDRQVAGPRPLRGEGRGGQRALPRRDGLLGPEK
jgi:hypothetical protein